MFWQLGCGILAVILLRRRLVLGNPQNVGEGV